MRNNIFDFATSELTHDAILCWIINGFNKDRSTPKFWQFSKDFLDTLQLGINLDDYNKVEVERQYPLKNDQKNRRIDVFATLTNAKTNEEYFLVIEDKLFTGEHNNQFENYTCGIKEFLSQKEDKIKFVNIIIGNYSKYFKKKVEDLNWVVYGREKLLCLMEKELDYVSEEFVLLKYYKEYLERINKEYLGYKEKSDFNNWTSMNIQGFLNEVASMHDYSDYGLVSNKKGGFWGLWFKKYRFEFYKGYEYNLYLQLELVEEKASEWIISVKLEDKKYDDESKNYSKEFRKVLNPILYQYGFDQKQNRSYKSMTIGTKALLSTTISKIHEEIDKYLEDFDKILMEIEINLEKVDNHINL